MKLTKKPNGELLLDYRLPRRLSIGIEISKPGKFLNFLKITLPDMGVYNVVALGSYNTRGIDENRHIIKYLGDIKFKPQFIEVIFEPLKEQE
jgi:hypothetical protein